MESIGELVQHPCEVGHEVAPPFLEGMPHRPQDAPAASPGIRWRAETDVAGDDGRAQIPLGHVVLGRDPPILGPVIEPVGVGPQELLEATEAEVV
jgi:hypothetical protein